MAIYCTRCGAALPPSSRFCSNCGAATAVYEAAAGWRPAIRPLVRPRAGRQLGGVCLALARGYGWDVSAVRIITLLALFFSSGMVGVAYLAAWVGIPEEPPDLSAASSPGVYPPGV